MLVEVNEVGRKELQ